jgi:hypothetical protein
MTEENTALAQTPFTETDTSQFFRPTVKGWITFSALLFEIWMFPFSSKRDR